MAQRRCRDKRMTVVSQAVAGAPTLGHCDLHRRVGVNNLPAVVARQYARPAVFELTTDRLWNQLPASLRQPRAGRSISDSDLPTHTSSAFSINSPLSSSITPSLFHSQL